MTAIEPTEPTDAQLPSPPEIGELRAEIDRLDSEILRLIKRRTEVSKMIGATRMASGGTRIVVTAGREDGHVQLVVRDDGNGIDRQALQRIFEPFFTADDAQGSGLGLAIASELAERMSGRLTVRSATGETVFTLEIPV